MNKMTVPPLLFQTTGLTNAALRKDEEVCIIVQGPCCPDSTLADLTSSGDCGSLLLSRHSGPGQLQAITELRMSACLSARPLTELQTSILETVTDWFLWNMLWIVSQWPRCLRHEPPSPAQTLGSWVRIPLNAWMSKYVILCLWCSVCR
jgi:hypothetical protein